MGNTRDFENILDECLERIIAGGETAQQCLAAYPEYADGLEPLLRTAAGAKASVDIEPSAEFRERAAYQFQAALRDMDAAKPRGLFRLQPRWAMSLAAIAVVLVAGSGTVVAAGGSLPDEPLYSVKLTAEAVKIALTPTDIGKAELYVKLADERVAEIIQMAEDGKVDYVLSTTQRLDGDLAGVSNNIAQPAADMGGAAIMESSPRMMMTEEPREALTAPGTDPVPPPAPEEDTFNATKAGPDAQGDTPPPNTAIAPLPTKPVLAPAPSTGLVPPPQGAYGAGGADSDLSAEEALKIVIGQRAAQNTQALLAILDRVPEDARPALLQALEVANSGYYRALDMLR